MIKRFLLPSFFTIVIGSLSKNFVSAQNYFNVSLLGGIPQASFATNTDNFHLGIGMDLLFKVNPDFPFYLGLGYN